MLKKWSLLFVLVLFVSTVACSQGEKGQLDEQGQEQKQENRKELMVAIGSEPDSGFDPTVGWGRYGSPLFQSTLLKLDQQLQIVNDLATNYTISDDGLIWTVELREDVKFSDGETLTANDVLFTYEKAKNSGSIIDLTIVDKITVVDPTKVQFLLKEPQSTFVNVLATIGIVPEHAYGEAYAEQPIGSGPFKLVQWDKGQQLIVESNPYYYGEKPYFEKLTFLFLNEDTAFAAAKSGQVDIASIPAAFSSQQVDGMRLHSFESIDNRGIVFPYVPSGESNDAGHPIGNDVTSDIFIRKAINIAVDRNLLVEGVLEGHGTPAYTSCDSLPWWNSNTIIEDGNVQQAEELLTEGGWIDTDGDGIREKGHVRAQFQLIYPASDGTRQSLAIAVADMLKPIGIEVNVEGKSWDDIEALMHSNAVMMGWGSYDPLEMYNLYSSSFAGLGWYNTGYYGNETVDEYMENALRATDINKAMEYWQLSQWDGKTGSSALGDAPWAWLVNINHLYLVNEKLHIGEQKIQPHGHGWPITDNIAQWRWKDE